MQQRNSYEATYRVSLRAAWDLDSVLEPTQELDFTLQFLPERLARTEALGSLSAYERRLLNQISAHQYLSLFIIVEEFILPFLLDHAREATRNDRYGMRALLNFAGEEVKHMQLFRRFLDAFNRGFPVRCEVIGPPEAIGQEVLRHHPMSVAFTILMFEWMSQVHYVDSIRDDGQIDPLFKSLMKHHWMEEAQHAKLDALIIDALARDYSAAEMDQAVIEFFEIGAFLDGGLTQQAKLNVEALERAAGRALPDRDEIVAQQLDAARWTYIGSGMSHPKFLELLERVAPNGGKRVIEAAQAFAA
ncbi:MAG: diiron oxygenase [Sphingomicrobium sp.]